MPGAGPVCGHGLAAPGALRRPADLQRDIAYLRIAVEPDVVDGAARAVAHIRPTHQLTDAGGEHGPRILRLAVRHRPCDDRFR